MLELERKLSVEGSLTPPLAAAGAGIEGIEERGPLDLRATYYDTPDLRLARSGITLRHRTGEADRPPWTLKLPEGEDSSRRVELEFSGPAGVVPDAAEDLVAAFVRTAALTPVARLRTRRRRWSLRDHEGNEIAELVDDRVSVLQRGRVVERFREVEIESKGIGPDGVGRIAELLRKNGAGEAPQVPKLVRALGRRATAPPEVVVPERLASDADAGEAVRAAIARSVERIMVNDPRTRLGEVEPLHQMRVGTRRLRSDLKTFRPLVDRQWSDALREELRWLGQVLGDVRDLDVMIERLRIDAGELEPELAPLFEELEARRRRARTDLLQSVSSARYIELLDRLVEAATSPSLTAAAEEPARAALPPLVRIAWRKARRQARKLDDASRDDEYHRVRVLTKRARYGADAVAPALARKKAGRARKFAKRAADVQDVLGELQDSVVAGATIDEVARAHPENAPFSLAAGRLIERELSRRKGNRQRFPSAWRRLDRKRRTNWM